MEEISVRIYRFLQGDETALDFQRPYDDVNGNPVRVPIKNLDWDALKKINKDI